MEWGDAEFQALMLVTARLAELEPEARLRVLRYVVDRLGLRVLLLKARLVPDADHCEEIGACCLDA